MNLLLRHIFILTTLLLPVLSHANTTWIPIGVGDITIIIPFTPNSPFMAPVNMQVISNGTGKILSWNDIEHASKYEIQGLNAQGQWVSILVTNATSVTLDSRFSGVSSVRVVACTFTSCINTGSWSGLVSVGRKVIYIHTDLLGSPVAETDENGDVN